MTEATTASRDLSLLAPKFRQAVEASTAECIAKGYPVKVAEALRSQERQAYLYAQGRTRPGQKVTNAPTNLTSWHGYGLAVDVIHETKGWAPGKNNVETTAWFAAVAAIFKAHGCAWGGDWRSPDMPHMQWGGMPASPQANHKALKQSKGNADVWRAVGAADPNWHGGGGNGGNTPATQSPRILRAGDRGDDVRAVQMTLKTKFIDGVFGSGTAEAVRKFQTSHGLTADGIVGDKTRKALGL